MAVSLGNNPGRYDFLDPVCHVPQTGHSAMDLDVSLSTMMQFSRPDDANLSILKYEQSGSDLRTKVSTVVASPPKRRAQQKPTVVDAQKGLHGLPKGDGLSEAVEDEQSARAKPDDDQSIIDGATSNHRNPDKPNLSNQETTGDIGCDTPKEGQPDEARDDATTIARDQDTKSDFDRQFDTMKPKAKLGGSYSLLALGEDRRDLHAPVIDYTHQWPRTNYVYDSLYYHCKNPLTAPMNCAASIGTWMEMHLLAPGSLPEFMEMPLNQRKTFISDKTWAWMGEPLLPSDWLVNNQKQNKRLTEELENGPVIPKRLWSGSETAVNKVNHELNVASTYINAWKPTPGRLYRGFRAHDIRNIENDLEKTISTLMSACKDLSPKFKKLSELSREELNQKSLSVQLKSKGPLVGILKRIAADREKVSNVFDRKLSREIDNLVKLLQLSSASVKLDAVSALVAQLIIDHQAILELTSVDENGADAVLKKRKESTIQVLRGLGFVSFSHAEKILEAMGSLSSGLSNKESALNYVLFGHDQWLPFPRLAKQLWGTKEKLTKEQVAQKFAKMVTDLEDGNSIRLVGSKTFGLKPEWVHSFAQSAALGQPFLGFTAGMTIEKKYESYIKFKKQGNKIIVSFGQHTPMTVLASFNLWTGFKPLPGKIGETIAFQALAGLKGNGEWGDEDVLNMAFDVADLEALTTKSGKTGDNLAVKIFNGEAIDPLELLTMGLDKTAEHFRKLKANFAATCGLEVSSKVQYDVSDKFILQKFISPLGFSISLDLVGYIKKSGYKTDKNGAAKYEKEVEEYNLSTDTIAVTVNVDLPQNQTRARGNFPTGDGGGAFDDESGGPSNTQNSGLRLQYVAERVKRSELRRLKQGAPTAADKVTVKRNAQSAQPVETGANCRTQGSQTDRDIGQIVWENKIPREKEAMLNPDVIAIYAKEDAPKLIAAVSFAKEGVLQKVENELGRIRNAVGDPANFLPEEKAAASRILGAIAELQVRRGFLAKSDRKQFLVQAHLLQAMIKDQFRQDVSDPDNTRCLNPIQYWDINAACRNLINLTDYRSDNNGFVSWKSEATQYEAFSNFISSKEETSERYKRLVDAISYTSRDNIDEIKKQLDNLDREDAFGLAEQCRELRAKSDFLSRDSLHDFRMKLGKMRRELKAEHLRQSDGKWYRGRLLRKKWVELERGIYDGGSRMIEWLPSTPSFNIAVSRMSVRLSRFNQGSNRYRIIRYLANAIRFGGYVIRAGGFVLGIAASTLRYMVVGRRDNFTPSRIPFVGDQTQKNARLVELQEIFAKLDELTKPADADRWPVRSDARYVVAKMEATTEDVMKFNEARLADDELKTEVGDFKLGRVTGFEVEHTRKRSTGGGMSLLLKFWNSASLELTKRERFTVKPKEVVPVQDEETDEL